jgi:TPR repeat protein
MTGAGDVLPTQPDQSPQAQNKEAQKQLTESDIPAQGASPNQSQGASSTAPNAAAQNTPTQNSAATQATAAQTPDSAEQTAPESAKEAKATPPPRVSEASKVTRETPRARAAKPTPAQAAAPAPGSQDADLEAAGERYLYGNGVPQNCARAEMSLRTAAMHGNTKAETVLGTMYATGHCVGRDLPTAYRWFARALHDEPTNSRISEDLQVLWRQMSPQEKQLATAMR